MDMEKTPYCQFYKVNTVILLLPHSQIYLSPQPPHLLCNSSAFSGSLPRPEIQYCALSHLDRSQNCPIKSKCMHTIFVSS